MMTTTWDFSATNDEGAVLTGIATFVITYLLGSEPLNTSIGLAIMAGLAVLGYTGASTVADKV
jgi:hypothetical protein